MRMGIEYIQFKDTMYTLERMIKESNIMIPENGSINDLTEYFRCDKVLKKNGFYFFCKEVIEVEEVLDNNKELGE